MFWNANLVPRVSMSMLWWLVLCWQHSTLEGGESEGRSSIFVLGTVEDIGTWWSCNTWRPDTWRVLSLSFPRHHGSSLTHQCLPGPEHVHVTHMDDKWESKEESGNAYKQKWVLITQRLSLTWLGSAGSWGLSPCRDRSTGSWRWSWTGPTRSYPLPSPACCSAASPPSLVICITRILRSNYI